MQIYYNIFNSKEKLLVWLIYRTKQNIQVLSNAVERLFDAKLQLTSQYKPFMVFTDKPVDRVRV